MHSEGQDSKKSISLQLSKNSPNWYECTVFFSSFRKKKKQYYSMISFKSSQHLQNLHTKPIDIKTEDNNWQCNADHS